MIEKNVKLDSIEYVGASAYCLGRSFLFNMFFGWRSTRMTDQGEISRFVLPKKAWKEIEILKTLFEKKNGNI